jgi:carbonic anhydrase/acetyltransferase-like protein (isoleucine patch superfamily)
VWPTAVIRGDSDAITIGDDSNVQDGTVIHVDEGVPTTIGKRVAIGHRAIVHGSTVEDDCLIAMGAILLNGVHVGSGSIVAAGAMCPEGMKIPPNSLALGIPARVIREVRSEERDRIKKTVSAYVQLQAEHRSGKHTVLSSGATPSS